MNPKSSTGLPSHLTLCSILLIAAALWNSPAPAAIPAPGPGEIATAKAIPWPQLGAAAGAQYSGDGLTVSQTEQRARLSCVFQRLEGEATREGLWLNSTVPDQPNDRFRVTAVEVGREGWAGSPLPADGAQGVTRPTRFAPTGEVSVDGQTVRFTRPGLVEEYTVSMDGVRQDFVVLEKPGGTSVPASRLASSLAPPKEGQLRVELAVTSARVEPIAGGVHPVRYAGQGVDLERNNMLSHGARLVLEKSGRKIAYSRLRVTDATGKELTSRMEVAASRQSAAEIKQEDDGGLPTRRYACLAVVVDDAQAVYPIRIDPTFSDANWNSMGGFPGAGGTVFATVVDGSGNLYIGGNFTFVGDTLANYIAKWNGNNWTALGSGMNGSVTALALSGTDLYAGGQFTMAGGSAANRIAKWNGNSWTALGSGMTQIVSALAVSGTDVYAGGQFTTVGGKVSVAVAHAVLADAPGYNQLTGTPLSEGAMQFSYIGYPATNYALDRAFDLSPPIGWVGQQTNTMTVSGVLSFTNTPAPGTNNFWRVRSVP